MVWAEHVGILVVRDGQEGGGPWLVDRWIWTSDVGLELWSPRRACQGQSREGRAQGPDVAQQEVCGGGSPPHSTPPPSASTTLLFTGFSPTLLLHIRLPETKPYPFQLLTRPHLLFSCSLVCSPHRGTTASVAVCCNSYLTGLPRFILQSASASCRAATVIVVKI